MGRVTRRERGRGGRRGETEGDGGRRGSKKVRKEKEGSERKESVGSKNGVEKGKI